MAIVKRVTPKYCFSSQVIKTAKQLKDKGQVHASMLLYGHGDGGGGPS